MAAIASSVLAPLLTQRSSFLEILGSSSELLWLSLDGRALTIQRSEPDSHLALPISIFTDAQIPRPTEISLDNGQLSLSGVPLQISRWSLPPRAKIATWNGTFGAAPKVQSLLGRGVGLTPEGDDVLAGWLVMARSISHPEFEDIRNQVLEASATKTTSFSAALLGCAGKGYGVAPLVDYVTSHLSNPSQTSASRRKLEAVGHTSGRALAHGVDMALGLAGQIDLNFFDSK